MDTSVKFARTVFRYAGIYGLIVLLPMFLLRSRFEADNPPPLTHWEFYYGFVAVAAAFQIVFLIISSDPIRFRPMMIAGMFEKFGYDLAMLILFLMNAIPLRGLFFPVIDLFLGILFVISYVRTPSA